MKNVNVLTTPDPVNARINENVQQTFENIKEGTDSKTGQEAAFNIYPSPLWMSTKEFKKVVNTRVAFAAFHAAFTNKPLVQEEEKDKVRVFRKNKKDIVITNKKHLSKRLLHLKEPSPWVVVQDHVLLSPEQISEIFEGVIEITLEEAKEDNEKYFTSQKAFSRGGKITLYHLVWSVMSLSDTTNNKEIGKFCTRVHMPLFSQTALYYARQKIHPRLFVVIMERFYKEIRKYLPRRGYNRLAIDGCQFNYPFNPKEPEAGIKTKGGYYAHIHATCLQDTLTGLFVAVRLSQGTKTGEADALIDILESGILSKTDVVISDRLYCIYKVLAAFKESGVQFLIRSKDIESSTGIFKNKALPKKATFDTYVTYHLSYRQIKKLMYDPDYKFLDKKKFPYYKKGEDVYEIRVRVIRYEHNGEYYTLVTSIPKTKLSTKEVIKLYSERWQIEIGFKHLKKSCKLEYFHSKSIWLNSQELLARLALYNVAKAMTLYVPKVKKGKNYYKVAFSTVFPTIVNFLFNIVEEEFLLDQMNRTMAIEKNNRHYPRVKKIKMIPSYNNR